jgi:hypothetical protein
MNGIGFTGDCSQSVPTSGSVSAEFAGLSHASESRFGPTAKQVGSSDASARMIRRMIYMASSYACPDFSGSLNSSAFPASFSKVNVCEQSAK